MGTIPFSDIEHKWQKRWDEERLYRFDVQNVDKEKKCYCLVMFSYPSGEKLHVGHWYNFGPTDTWARFRRMQGCQVFEPMGFDAFGLPAENYAIKTGVHPRTSTLKNIKIMEEQLRAIGAMYDWDYEVVTCEPDYYRWTQWLFLQLYEKKLAYRAKAPVNWCPSCQTTLANEQVHSGACERCDTEVTKKDLTQWFFKITDYVEELLEGLHHLDWPEKTKAMQRNWIGRSEGAEITFAIDGTDRDFTVFTTRPDTLFGATYVVLAPELPLVDEITSPEHREAVRAYQQASRRISDLDRTSQVKDKSGVFTGAYAINPINDEKIPIWIADYVLASYGTGCVMAVPAHDERDFEFAKMFDLPIRTVILEPGTTPETELEAAFVGVGTMVNSGDFDGMPSDEGIRAITDHLEEKSRGKATVTYRLRDWLISRQRYWGAPIPIVYCEKCGEVPIADEDLPVLLPEDVDFSPTGRSPLATCESFVHTSCPSCGGDAEREVDTMDTFVCSSWYFLRYPCAGDHEEPFSREVMNRLLPVDKYVGGAEHACMHLLYARFINMALHDMGHLNFKEPFLSLTHQGVILGPDGSRMSKSRGNVIAPEQYLERYGADVFRSYLMFGFAYDEGGAWDDSGIKAIERFFERVWRWMEDHDFLFRPSDHDGESSTPGPHEKELNRVRHRSIKGITEDTERFQFNTPISRMMELTNALYKYSSDVPRKEMARELLTECAEDLLRVLAPYAPHFVEEVWERTHHERSVFHETWPAFDENAIKTETITMAVQINGKIRAQLTIPADMPHEEIKQRAQEEGRVPSLLEGKAIKKIILVPGKLVNIVAK